MHIHIRLAEDTDLAAIVALAHAAFGPREGPEIEPLIRSLLADPTAEPRLSLVAVADSRIIGHVLFSRAGVAGPERPVSAAILAPLAVHPDHQRSGIGGRLIAAGLDRLRAGATDLVFVLGHPDYYPRHGFRPAGELGFEAPYPIPPAAAPAWMVQALHSRHPAGLHGRVSCADALSHRHLWLE